jgi:uncharacterized membrane protein
MLQYPLIVGCIVGVINILLYMINQKFENKTWTNMDLFKMFIHGFIISGGVLYIFMLYTNYEPSSLIKAVTSSSGGSDQDIMLGTPNF